MTLTDPIRSLGPCSGWSRRPSLLLGYGLGSHRQWLRACCCFQLSLALVEANLRFLASLSVNFCSGPLVVIVDLGLGRLIGFVTALSRLWWLFCLYLAGPKPSGLAHVLRLFLNLTSLVTHLLQFTFFVGHSL